MGSKASSKDSSIDESRPLCPRPDEDSPRSLNPDMVHPALTSPQDDYQEPDGHHELSVRLITILRSLIFIFTIANIVIQLASPARNSLEVFLIVWDWFILIWSILTLLAETRFPSITVTIGHWKFQCFGNRKNYSYNTAQKTAKPPGRHGPLRALYNVVDVLLALILLIISIVHAASHSSHSRSGRDNTAIDVIHFFTFGFMLAVLILRVIQARRGVSVYIKLYASRDEEGNDQHKYRIRLPNDDEPQMMQASG